MGRTYIKQRRSEVDKKIKIRKNNQKANKIIQKTIIGLNLLRNALIDFYDYKFKDPNFSTSELECIKAAKLLNEMGELNLSENLVTKVAKDFFKTIEKVYDNRINNPETEEEKDELKEDI